MRRRMGMALFAAAMAALALAATPAAADPSVESNPEAFLSTATCPGGQTFEVTVVGFAAFAEGERLLLIHQAPGTGNLDLVPCLATHPLFPPRIIFLQFVERG